MFWVIFWHPYLSREVNFYFNQDKKTKTKWNYFGDVQGSQMLSFCHIRGVFTMCFFFFCFRTSSSQCIFGSNCITANVVLPWNHPISPSPVGCAFWCHCDAPLKLNAFDFRGTWRYASTLRSSVGPRAFVAHTHWNGLALPLHVAKCSEKMP